ncbi:MAG: F0F1 ATP synthase subunit gamma [Ignavibacteria bacterium]|nr:F0F1 ATP synthase subunit gamma [Ignavibacteria bacterium]
MSQKLIKSEIAELETIKDIADILFPYSLNVYNKISILNKQILTIFFESFQIDLKQIEPLKLLFYTQNLINLRVKLNLGNNVEVLNSPRIVLVLTSELPFCGKFDYQIFEKLGEKEKNNHYSKKIIFGRRKIFKEQIDLNVDFKPFILKKEPSLNEISNLLGCLDGFFSNLLETYFANYPFVLIDVIYNELNRLDFTGSLTLNTRCYENLLLVNEKHPILEPILPRDTIKEFGLEVSVNDYLLDPDEKITFDKINFFIKKAFEFSKIVTLYLIVYSLIQSVLSENFERKQILQKTSDEAEIQIKNLRRKLNKIRQAKITKELTELMNSYEAL